MDTTRTIKIEKGIKLTDKDEIQLYVYGGKGRFILKSLKSDKQFEYKISPMSKRHPKYDEYTYYVSLKLDNGVTDFLGVLKTEDNKYIHSKKCRYDFNSHQVRGIRWILEQFEKEGDFPEMMEFYHMGVCSCCSRTLTTPESIKMGIGPVCFERYGNKRLKKLMHLKEKIAKKMTKTNRTLN